MIHFMRNTFIFFFCMLCFVAKGQSIVGGQVSSLKSDTISKAVVDRALYRVYYDFKFAPNAEFPKDKKIAITLLQIGKTHNRFVDYNELRSDSICDANIKNEIPLMQYFPSLQHAMQLKGYGSKIMIDRRLKQAHVQESVALDNYKYDEPMPEIAWTLEEGDTIIAGYECKKAKCKIYGREYVGWYSPGIPLPYGPYMFYGLPGLIFKITDTENNFDFTIAGLQQVDYYDPIYVKEYGNEVRSSREEVRKIEKNYCANPAKGLKASGKVIMSDEDWESIPSKPYNPIDRE